MTAVPDAIAGVPPDDAAEPPEDDDPRDAISCHRNGPWYVSPWGYLPPLNGPGPRPWWRP